MGNQATEGLPPRPGIVFMGTPDFAVPALRALAAQAHKILAVVTQPDRPRGRGRKRSPSPVKEVAEAHGMDLLQPERASDPAFCDAIRDRAPDILIVVAFGQILKRPLLEIPRWGALNIHASLLPRYRGAAPIQWAILNNETRTGLTAIRMDEGMDTGPILLQEEVGIGTDETAGQLHDRLSALSAPFLLRVLEGLAKKEIRERPQDPGGASFTGKIDPHMARIRWERPAREIAGLIRALDPWPGARTRLGRKEIKLFSPRVLEQEDTGLVPGRVKGYTGEGLEIETGGGLLRVGELQAPGKKRLPAEAFLRGFTVDSGTLLGK